MNSNSHLIQFKNGIKLNKIDIDDFFKNSQQKWRKKKIFILHLVKYQADESTKIGSKVKIQLYLAVETWRSRHGTYQVGTDFSWH